ncbi:MAG: hypothetical protein CMP58_03635 [Flavobacteriales bacterium]|nr:hypothetical protein [Flavobacteriales bacterium]
MLKVDYGVQGRAHRLRAVQGRAPEEDRSTWQPMAPGHVRRRLGASPRRRRMARYPHQPALHRQADPHGPQPQLDLRDAALALDARHANRRPVARRPHAQQALRAGVRRVGLLSADATSV